MNKLLSINLEKINGDFTLESDHIENKKIFSISMVKNEMDIIESFVRYNANIFDGMIILDNCSSDTTFKILKLLENEGLPLFIFKDKDMEYSQAVKMNQLLLKAVNEFEADIIVPLDADEFLISSNNLSKQLFLSILQLIVSIGIPSGFTFSPGCKSLSNLIS